MNANNVHWVFDDPKRFRTMTACPHTTHGPRWELSSGRFPVANMFHYWRLNWWSRDNHNWCHSSVENRPEHYAYNIGTWNDASYWTGWPDNTYGYEPFVKFVPPEVLADAKNSKALLVVDNLNEGFYDTKLYEYFHKICAEYHIPTKSILFLTGNELDVDGYKQWCDINKINDRISIIGFPHLMYMQQLNLRRSKSVEWNDHKIAKANQHSVKLFNCLNRVSRHHREVMVMRLIEHDLHLHSMISHNTLVYDNWTAHGVPQEVVDKANNTLPLIIDDADFNNNKAMQINRNIYLKSWASVITETHAFDEPYNLFISEKMWKPIWALQPFMVLGHQGTLAKLKSWGFETFDTVFDETYDTAPFADRVAIILKNLQHFSFVRDKISWLEQTKEICIHNQQWFLSRNWFKTSAYTEFMNVYNGSKTC